MRAEDGQLPCLEGASLCRVSRGQAAGGPDPRGPRSGWGRGPWSSVCAGRLQGWHHHVRPAWGPGPVWGGRE